MAAKTAFVADDFHQLLGHYDLGVYISHRAFEKGTDQTNVLLSTSEGKYAFRYYEKRQIEYVKFEIMLLLYLAERSYPCPSPIPLKDGRYTNVYHGKPFALFTYLEGEHNDNQVNYRQVAQVIARLHALTLGYKPDYHTSRAKYDPAYCWLYATANAAKLSSESEAQERLVWVRKELDRLVLPDDLPKGICHGDSNPSNFLYQDDHLTAVLDFDQSSYTWLIYDLAQMIGWWTWSKDGDIDFPSTRKLIQHYERVRKLEDLEKTFLYDMLKMTLLVSLGWFIHSYGYEHDRRKINYLNSLGQEQFFNLLFSD